MLGKTGFMDIPVIFARLLMTLTASASLLVAIYFVTQDKPSLGNRVIDERSGKTPKETTHRTKVSIPSDAFLTTLLTRLLGNHFQQAMLRAGDSSNTDRMGVRSDRGPLLYDRIYDRKRKN